MSQNESFADLDYLIYAPIPRRGYAIRAKTAGVIEDVFLTAHKEILSPYDELVFSNFQIEARVVTKPSVSAPIYFSRIYKRQRLDDLGRDGIVSVIVAVPTALLSDGLAFKDVGNALIELEKRTSGVPMGEVPKLRVPWKARDSIDSDMINMPSMVPRESANRLVSILSEGMDSKAFVLCKSSYNDRNELCTALGKFLYMVGKESYTVTSDCPMDTFLGYYSNVVISDFLPKLKVGSGWKIINLGNPSKQESNTAKNSDQILKGMYEQTSSEPSAKILASATMSDQTLITDEAKRQMQVFISHSFKDHALKDILQTVLRKEGLRTYVAQDSLYLGASIQEKVRRKIIDSQYVVAIYSKANPSGAVEQEVAIALEQRKKVIPIVEKGAEPGFMVQPLERVEFEEGGFTTACERVAKEIARGRELRDIGE